MKKWMWILVTAWIVGCGSDDPKKQTQSPTDISLSVAGHEFLMLEKGDLKLDEGKLVGSGKVLFVKPRSRKDNNYVIRLKLSENGKLALRAHSSKKGNEGVLLTFARTDKEAWKVTLDADKHWDVSEDFRGISARDEVIFSVDVHEHNHIIIWHEDKELGHYFFNKAIPGLFWGLELNHAEVLSVDIQEARDAS